MTSGGDLLRAEAEAKQARTQLFATLHQVQEKISPRNIAEEALEGAKARGQAAVETVRRNPGPSAAVAGALVLFAARKPLLRLTRRLFSRGGATPASDEG